MVHSLRVTHLLVRPVTWYTPYSSDRNTTKRSEMNTASNVDKNSIHTIHQG